MSNQTLNRELEKLESDIKQSVMDADEFLFAKLNRAKDELNQKIFFAESRNLKSEIENLSSERQAAFDVIADLTEELTIQAEKVRELRSQAYDEQEKHNQLSFKIHVLRTKTENDRDTIKDLQRKLDLSVDMKLNPDKYDESGNLKKGEN